MENTLSENDLYALYAASNESGRSILEKRYGKDFFSGKEWKELFSIFCKSKNLTITHDAAIARTESGYVYIPHADPQNPSEEHDNASRMIRTIIAHHNAEKKFTADYKNKSQYKWFPIFKMTETGLVFSHTNDEDWISSSDAYVGAPFVTPTSEDAEKIAREYSPIYVKFLQ